MGETLIMPFLNNHQVHHQLRFLCPGRKSIPFPPAALKELLALPVLPQPWIDAPELHKCPPLYRDIERRNIGQTPIGQLLIPLLAQPLDEAVRLQRLGQSVRSESILRKAEVEQGRDLYAWGAELFLLLGQV